MCDVASTTVAWPAYQKFNNIIIKETVPKKPINEFRNRFQRYDEETSQAESKSAIINNVITDYVNYVKSANLNKDKTVLDFWRENEHRWPILANISKKILGVPASSAKVERIFSIAGHVFSLKRRRMKARIFESLVFAKLNEYLINLFN